MLGTIVNTAAVVIGGAFGLLIKGGLKEKYKNIIMQALALAVLFIGISSAVGNMIKEGAEPVLFIISLVIGSGLGELADLDGKLQKLGDTLQSKLGSKGGNVSQAFVTTSLVFCVGTMSILGSLESGIQGVHTTLFVKSVLDGTSAIIFASTLGVGVLFSGVVILIYQGALTLGASLLQPYLTVDMLREISIVGGILIFGIGLNLLELKKIKLANMLPSIVIPVLYYLPFVQNLFSRLGF